MTSFRVAGPLQKLRGGSSSQSGSSSVNYDYSGLEDHIKRQDAVEALRGQKFSALYAGNIPAAIEAGSKVRSLVGALQKVDPDTTERDPHRITGPLVKISSSSSSSNQSSEGPEAQFFRDGEQEPLPGQEAAPLAVVDRKRLAGQV